MADKPVLGYKPLPATERREPIRAAIEVLCDPDIPLVHEQGNHNCGECWTCIYTTLGLVDLMRKGKF